MTTQVIITFLVMLTVLGNRLVANAFVSGYHPKSWSHSPSVSTTLFEGVERELPVVPVTPCTRICRYNANVFDGQVCIGCFRETYEIGHWQRMTATEKYYALLDAIERLENVSFLMMDESDTGTSRDELLRQADYWKSQAS
jgi:predicted Fe-S protein YdhL (DUF1289 family)